MDALRSSRLRGCLENSDYGLIRPLVSSHSVDGDVCVYTGFIYSEISGQDLLLISAQPLKIIVDLTDLQENHRLQL